MITSFAGEHAFLSNFFPSPILYDGVLYPTVEHAFQAMKIPSDNKLARTRIATMPTPGRAKRAGRELPLRSDWEEIKLEVMSFFVREKFNIPELATMLLATGDRYLIEGNTWNDRYWGVCDGRGKNNLGHILMQVREEITP